MYLSTVRVVVVIHASRASSMSSMCACDRSGKLSICRSGTLMNSSQLVLWYPWVCRVGVSISEVKISVSIGMSALAVRGPGVMA